MPRGRPKPIGPEILDYRHKGIKRKNNPEDGLATYLPEELVQERYKYDPHLDPQLIWSGKDEHNKFDVPVVPLHVHERVVPKTLVSLTRKKEDRQIRLFDEEEYPLDKRIDFYQHDVDWANRLILGDSLVVMNSLLTKELMSGRVQMIYFDPPYGIDYGSNFQPTLSSHDVRNGKDSSVTRELEQIKAYRDTWRLGIHSYLTYLRDRLLLCKELLAASGSIFLQISDDNLAHVRELMDEVFGSENRIGIIILQKTSISTSTNLATVNDYLLWYARDATQVKYHQLFREKTMEREGQTYTKLVGPKGEIRGVTKEERENGIPKGWKMATLGILTSPSPGSRYAVEFRGKTYWPTGQAYWKTDQQGMKKLIDAGRIAATGNTLRYIRYWDDFKGAAYNNLWTDAVSWGFGDEKIYVVQTNYRIVERCILMTTDPSDLILDPTCGSGTSAYAAEKWGRRWITCDTSRVALSLARKRLITSSFPYYSLAHPDEGLKSGFEYETTSHITLSSIAQNESPAIEVFLDKPQIDKLVVRVSGPFTVEGIPPPTMDAADKIQPDRRTGTVEYIDTLIEAARKSGFIFPGGKRIQIRNLTSISSADYIHAEGIGSEAVAQKVAVSFGPRYGAMGVRQVETAVRTATANGYSMLLLAGFSFDPGARAFVEKTKLRIQVQFAQINPDMEIHDLLKQTQGSQLFSVLGEPDFAVKRDSGGKYLVILRGVDTYDPATGRTDQTEAEGLAAWFLDEDYDGYSFSISQAFFPSGATKADPWDKLENALRGSIDKEKIEAFRGTTSLPFDEGSHSTIAVKVIDERGNEVIKVQKLSGKK